MDHNTNTKEIRNYLRRLWLFFLDGIFGQHNDGDNKLKNTSEKEEKVTLRIEYLRLFAWSVICNNHDAMNTSLHNWLVTGVRRKTDKTRL